MSSPNQFPPWLDIDLYPFKSNFLELSDGKMHHLDEGKGDIILFVHGTPTWSFLYRDIIRHFAESYRCIALDHIGFGLSEKPVNFDGTPQSHSKNLTALIKKLNLTNITIVVHDSGGPIGICRDRLDPLGERRSSGIGKGYEEST